MQREFLERCYFHGVKPEARRETWPYLLQLIAWDEELEEYLPEWSQLYASEIKCWEKIEAEVVKRDCEQFQIGGSCQYKA
jgi:hypothetical protein